ncbi:bumetanide-sensitive sodium-(potassium)-chloride cotransporter-like [Anopheles stephensi]|uniref:bumetanide-sensitive sodium-(potassium)-chloride cotransporter-like n=1 Tax=Anopheles stephensi TaxID=30069 RepID=UPI001658A543|nr:bumetanide-sensitive sodium-(potassium)-chloride cotransporter-like [Anopheles stephensi]XP_035891267.1 bumetanide-sensitive sodium-(potassium)-chloride cotransporter-like [Anopheles stephensi]
MVWEQYGIVSVTNRVLRSIKRSQKIADKQPANGGNMQENAEQTSVTPPAAVPKVAIFTVDDEAADQSWASIDLESGYDDGAADNHLTRDPLPRLEHYRTSQKAIRRPSIGELHGDVDEQDSDSHAKHDTDPAGADHRVRLGWIQGVLIPCLLNIWGVMLFLRLSWIVSLAGILETLLIIGLSYLVCVITTLSLSAICTNGQVKGGGIYYLISRSLGPEFGGAVGIVLAFSNSVSASMNTIGFCSSLNQLLGSFGVKIVDGGVNDMRIVGTVTILIMVIICAIGMDWETKAQNVFVLAILLAIAGFMLGVLLGPRTDTDRGKGFTGLSSARFVDNLGPDYRFSEGIEQDFFSVFGIFFPSVTGVQAGANICGELKDPATAIPKGTLLALLISGISYVAFVLLAGSASYRDASGSLADLVNGTFATCQRTLPGQEPCKYGLHNDYNIMQLISVSGAVIYAGCFAATLSSSLTNLLSVPRIIQALGTDRLYPGLTFFAKGYGKRNEPYRSYALVLCVSVLFVLLANLNLVAPLISNFYLASYALINFCTFHAATVKPIGWRPTFRFYNQWVSLVGTVLCVLIMFLIDIISTGITMVLIFVLHLAVIYRKPDVNWGSTTQAQSYKSALSAALKLQCVGEHVKNYHPSVLVLTGLPASRPPLLDLAHQITKNQALLIVGDVVRDRLSHRKRELRLNDSRCFMEARKVQGFYELIDGIGLEKGVRALMQTSGVGKLSPNIVLVGYKADWMRCSVQELQTYYNVLNDVFDNRMSLAILRLPNGLDQSHLSSDLTSDASFGTVANVSLSSLEQIIDAAPPAHKLMYVDSNLGLLSSKKSLPKGETTKESPSNTSRDSIACSTRNGSCLPLELHDRLNVFHHKQPKGTIDVWWLYDDGGLTMLIPYILSLRSKWANCKVRVFALTNQQKELELEQKNMAHLLAKLRIDYSSLIMLQDVTKPPQPDTIVMHQQLLKSFEHMPTQLTPPELSSPERIALAEKTHRQLRLREMLLEHSAEARLIVMSMPMPRMGTVSAPLYMSWLEMLSKDMPPMLLVRGNQTSVLTFYS